MGQAIDVGDAQSQLSQARAQAESAAKDIGMGALSPTAQPPPPPLQVGRAPMNRKAALLTDPGPEAEVQPGQPSDADAIPHGDMATPPPPPPPPSDKDATDNGNPFSFSTLKNFLGDSLKGSGVAAADLLPRIAFKWGGFLTSAGAGLASIGDQAVDRINDRIEQIQGKQKMSLNPWAEGNHAKNQDSRMADSVFEFKKKYVDPAVANWTPTTESSTGAGDGQQSPLVGAIAGGAEVVPDLFLGGAGVAHILGSAFNDSAQQSIDQGQSAGTAVGMGTVDAIANAIQMKIGLSTDKLPMIRPLIQRVVSSMTLGDIVHVGAQVTKKMILLSEGLTDQAAKIDPLEGIGQTTIENALFGIPGGHDKKAEPKPKPGETPPGPSGDEGVIPAAPPAPPAPPLTTAGPTSPVSTGPLPGAASTVPDAPSIEPSKGLRAQIGDMNNKDTPRVGVLISEGSQANLAGSKDANALAVNGVLNQARAQGRTIKLPQGELILKTAKIAKATQERLTAGEDPQKVIGSVTGAGEGKTPDQTAVVQGKDAGGNVTTETAAAPSEVPAAVQKVVDQGKTPEVTTPEAAVQKRIDDVSTERNTPTTMGVMVHPDGREMAVHIEPGAPEGMVRVRALDADGEPSARTVDVAKDRVKVGAPKAKTVDTSAETKAPPVSDTGVEQTPTPVEAAAAVAKDKAEAAPAGLESQSKPETRPVEDTAPPKSEFETARAAEVARRQAMTPEELAKEREDAQDKKIYGDAFTPEEIAADKAKAKAPLKAKKIQTGLEALPAALEAHEKQEVPQPGRKNVPLAERQQNAGDFAAVLKAAADAARGKVDVSAIERATKAAKAAEGIAGKGKEETAAGKGTNQIKVTAIVNEMHKAARGLLGTAREGDDVTVKPKEAELVAKRARTAERTKKAAGIESDTTSTDEAKNAVDRLEKDRAIRAAYDKFNAIDDPSSEDEDNLGRTVSKILGKDFAVKHDEEGNADVQHALDELGKAPVKKAAVITAKRSHKAKPKVEEAPKEPSKGGMSKAEIDRESQRLSDRYVSADEEDLPAVRAQIEAHIKEHYADQYTPDQTRELLHLLQERRLDENPQAEQTGPRKMSDDAEEEQRVEDNSPKTLKTLGLRNIGKRALQFASTKLEQLKNTVFNNRMQEQYEKLATAMIKGGHLGDVVSHTDTGKGMSTHDLLNRMLANTDGELHGLLQTLRAHVPDLPVHFVSAIRNLRDNTSYGAHASGLFDPTYNSIQVVPSRRNAAATVKTMIHEMVHAATSYELLTNPGGHLATALENARQILIGRMERVYSRETVRQHLAYFESGAAKDKPANYNRALYGLTNTQEMLAELHVNHEFVQEIADSESFANPDEKFNDTFLGGAKTLLHKIYGAIGDFLGIKEPKLLQHIAGLSEKTMDLQHMKTQPGRSLDYLGHSKAADIEADLVKAMRAQFGANPLEISRALPSFEEVERDPPPLRGVEPEMRASFRDEEEAKEPMAIARLFKQAMNSGVVDGVRAIKTAFKTVPQIYRDHRRDFGGRNDPANPMNQMQDVDHQKAAIQRDLGEFSRDVSRRWMRVSDMDNKTIGTFVRDWTMNKVDPRKPFEEQEAAVKKGGSGRYDEFAKQWDSLQKANPEAARLISDIFDANRQLARAQRRANIDTAAEAFSETPITDAQRTLLYGARTKEAYEELVGPGKLVDVGENNDKFKEALKDFAGQPELTGPYAHLGRHGEYVVSATPEGTKTFRTEAEARAFEQQVNDLSPNSRGSYELRGGEHQVDYKVQYTSFHETRNEALAERERMRAAGYDVPLVTRKTMSRADTPVSAGARDLVSAVDAKIKRSNDNEDDRKALVASLHSAMLHIAASRSAYAGSQLARKNFAGVKPEEMRRSFADHTESTIWHTAQLRTTFKQAAALARLRNMSRDDAGADQQTMFRRGEAVTALNKHMQDEVQNFGHKSPTNARIARLGFMSFLGSPSHAFIWMTQNFTTGIPVAGARWGYGRASSTFMHAMGSVFSPAMRDAVNEAFSKGGATKDANEAMMRVLSKHDRWGKWAPQIRQMINDGVLGHGYGNELHEMAQAQGVGAKYMNRAFDFARLMPAMADSFNRVSSALTALEMTGGDVRKAADFVDEVHADYSAGAKPLAFKKLGRIPGMNSLTMFRTYTQSMIHLFYGNLKAAFDGSGEGGRIEAAKTAAGMVVANALFAGVYGAAAIEPLKLAVYAYHKVFDKEGEVSDLKNTIHNWLVDHMGKGLGDVAAGGLPHIAGFDLSSRMGLSDLFLHEPPDMFTADKSNWDKLAATLAGPMYDYLASNVTNFVKHMQRGEGFQAISSLVPVKAYQDSVKAYGLATTGKVNSIGGQMTKPSATDAAYQAFGLKPSSVADAQEASGTAFNYSSQVKATKNSILKDYVSSAPGSAKLRAQNRMNAFNRLHPAERIKLSEIKSMMKFQQESSSNVQGKDETLNKMLSYTRK